MLLGALAARAPPVAANMSTVSGNEQSERRGALIGATVAALHLSTGIRRMACDRLPRRL